MKKILSVLKRFCVLFYENEITVYSAQASYYIIISSIPFLMLLISLIGFLIPGEKEALILLIKSAMPDLVRPIMLNLVNELFEKSIYIASLTAVITIWTASRGMVAVERGIKKGYQVKYNHNLLVTWSLAIVYTLLFMFILVLTLFSQVFGNVIIGFASRYVTISADVVLMMKVLLFFVISTLLFAVMYYIFSNRVIPFGYHIPGAIFTSFGWMVFSKVYALYIENFPNFSYIYGSLAAIVFMFLWLYSCVMILLIGAIINKMLTEEKTFVEK